MNNRKIILQFVLALTSIDVWSLLTFNFGLIPGNIWAAMFFVSLLCCLYLGSRIITDFTFENAYFKVVFITFSIYHLIILARGLPHSYEEVKTMLQSGIMTWSLIVPLFVFSEKTVDNMVSFMKGMYYLTLVFLIAVILKPGLVTSWATAEAFIHPFAFGAGFLLMNARYLTRKKAVLSLLATIVAVLSFTYLARRNAILTFGGFLMAAFFLYIKNISFSRVVKFFPIFAIIFVAGFLYTDKIPASFTSKIAERAKEDSRSDLFAGFFKDMQGDMLFGRGANGAYYYPVGEVEMDDGVTFSAMDYRAAIENGYLHLILKGGYVELFLFIMILLPGACLGVFASRNNLARSCGMLVGLWLVDMVAYGLPNMGFQYIFVWISVGICYKGSFRRISEEEIYNAFKLSGL